MKTCPLGYGNSYPECIPDQTCPYYFKKHGCLFYEVMEGTATITTDGSNRNILVRK